MSDPSARELFDAIMQQRPAHPGVYALDDPPSDSWNANADFNAPPFRFPVDTASDVGRSASAASSQPGLVALHGVGSDKARGSSPHPVPALARPGPGRGPGASPAPSLAATDGSPAVSVVARPRPGPGGSRTPSVISAAAGSSAHPALPRTNAARGSVTNPGGRLPVPGEQSAARPAVVGPGPRPTTAGPRPRAQLAEAHTQHQQGHSHPMAAPHAPPVSAARQGSEAAEPPKQAPVQRPRRASHVSAVSESPLKQGVLTRAPPSPEDARPRASQWVSMLPLDAPETPASATPAVSAMGPGQSWAGSEPRDAAQGLGRSPGASADSQPLPTEGSSTGLRGSGPGSQASQTSHHASQRGSHHPSSHLSYHPGPQEPQEPHEYTEHTHLIPSRNPSRALSIGSSLPRSRASRPQAGTEGSLHESDSPSSRPAGPATPHGPASTAAVLAEKLEGGLRRAAALQALLGVRHAALDSVARRLGDVPVADAHDGVVDFGGPPAPVTPSARPPEGLVESHGPQRTPSPQASPLALRRQRREQAALERRAKGRVQPPTEADDSASAEQRLLSPAAPGIACCTALPRSRRVLLPPAAPSTDSEEDQPPVVVHREELTASPRSAAAATPTRAETLLRAKALLGSSARRGRPEDLLEEAWAHAAHRGLATSSDGLVRLGRGSQSPRGVYQAHSPQPRALSRSPSPLSRIPSDHSLPGAVREALDFFEAGPAARSTDRADPFALASLVVAGGPSTQPLQEAPVEQGPPEDAHRSSTAADTAAGPEHAAAVSTPRTNASPKQPKGHAARPAAAPTASEPMPTVAASRPAAAVVPPMAEVFALFDDSPAGAV